MADTITTSYIQSALQTLLFTNDSLEKTQKQVSSGYKISSPADDASYWSVANSMTSDNNILSSISDALGLGASKVDTAYSAVSSSIDVVDQIMDQLTTAKEDGVDKQSLNGTITSLKANLTSLVQSASFSSDNWLYNSTESGAATKQVPVYFQRSVSGAVSLSYATFDAGASTLIDTADSSRGLFTKDIDISDVSTDSPNTGSYYLLAADDGSQTGSPIELTDDTTSDQIDDMIDVMNSIRTQLTTLGSTLGTLSDRVDNQTSFVASLQDVMDKSVSNLVDADMEEESTKLSAYQSQQQLSSQILGMANTHLQSLAKLFQ